MNPNIEAIFEKMENHLKYNPEELSEDLSKLLITFLMLEGKNEPIPKELEKEWVIKAAKKHADAYKLNISPFALTYVSYYYQAIGIVVVALKYLKYLQDKYNYITNIDMSILSTDIFPMGFISKEKMIEYYDELKNMKYEKEEVDLDIPNIIVIE